MTWLHELSPEAVKLALAVLLGSLIGLEREVSDKAAGLRTNILICVGAALFTMLSQSFGSDHARIAAQIVSGIGFLGAGAIMREGDHVTGLTTAATIWAVAAVGMAVGYGQFALASAAAAGVLIVQLAFTPLDAIVDDWRMRHTFRIVSKFDDRSLDEIREIFRESRVRVIRRKLMKRGGMYFSEWYTAGGREQQERVLRKLLTSKEVVEVSY